MLAQSEQINKDTSSEKRNSAWFRNFIPATNHNNPIITTAATKNPDRKKKIPENKVHSPFPGLRIFTNDSQDYHDPSSVVPENAEESRDLEEVGEQIDEERGSRM